MWRLEQAITPVTIKRDGTEAVVKFEARVRLRNSSGDDAADTHRATDNLKRYIEERVEDDFAGVFGHLSQPEGY